MATTVVKKFGYSQCQSDHTLFINHSLSGRISIIIVYVDDIILTGDHEEEISKLKRFLANEFEVRDLGNLKYFIGMEIARSNTSIVILNVSMFLIYLRKLKC